MLKQISSNGFLFFLLLLEGFGQFAFSFYVANRGFWISLFWGVVSQWAIFRFRSKESLLLTCMIIYFGLSFISSSVYYYQNSDSENKDKITKLEQAKKFEPKKPSESTFDYDTARYRWDKEYARKINRELKRTENNNKINLENYNNSLISIRNHNSNIDKQIDDLKKSSSNKDFGIYFLLFIIAGVVSIALHFELQEYDKRTKEKAIRENSSLEAKVITLGSERYESNGNYRWNVSEIAEKVNVPIELVNQVLINNKIRKNRTQGTKKKRKQKQEKHDNVVPFQSREGIN